MPFPPLTPNPSPPRGEGSRASGRCGDCTLRDELITRSVITALQPFSTSGGMFLMHRRITAKRPSAKKAKHEPIHSQKTMEPCARKSHQAPLVHSAILIVYRMSKTSSPMKHRAHMIPGSSHRKISPPVGS